MEPVILYALVCGRSGTNKSCSLKVILELLNGIENNTEASHTFDSGTLEGLMQSLRLNNGIVMACHDEFSTFNENLDKGNSGSCEKQAFVAVFWC